MNYSVIIPAWNGASDMGNCLRAVQAQYPSPLEVLVVDNGSSDGSADLVARDFPWVRLIRHDRNCGFAGGCNTGLHAARGDLLVLLNQDTIVQAGWLAALGAAATPGVGIVGALAVRADGQVQHAGGVVNTRGEGYHVTDLGSSDPDYVTGASLAITRECYEAIGDLDEGFSPAYYEDVDWCFRAHAAGYRVVLAPSAVLVHLERSAAAQRAEHAYEFHRNRIRFVLKHWDAERLRCEFAPAEHDWLASLGEGGEGLIAAMHRAYFDHLLRLPEVMRSRAGGSHAGEDAAAIAEVLAGLRTVLPLPPARVGATAPPPGADHVMRAAARRRSMPLAGPMGAATAPDAVALRDPIPSANSLSTWSLTEPAFRSSLPIVGRLIAGFRSLFNQISTRWYVLPLMEQQSAINRRLAEKLNQALAQASEAQTRYDQLAEEMRISRTVWDAFEESHSQFDETLLAYQRAPSTDRERLAAVWAAYAQELAREISELAQLVGESQPAGRRGLPGS